MLAELTKTLQITQQALGEILEIPTPERVPLTPEDASKRRQLPTDWPRIGGREFDPGPTLLFETEEFRKAWRPSDVRRACYAAGCDGLANVSKILKMPGYKVSTCGADRLWDRMKELKRDRYGALWHNGEAYVEDAEGWDNWFPSHLYPRRFPSPSSPVIAEKRTVIVPLPIGMTPRKFDDLFDAEVKKGALNIWVMTQAGRDHCAFVDAVPAVGQRSTRFGEGCQSKISPANEICGFSIHSGADLLIAIIEKIIIEAVGLTLDAGAKVKD